MLGHYLQDLIEREAIHAVSQERRINRIVLLLGALFVFFLMWTVMVNFTMCIKAVTIATIIVYFLMCFHVHDKLKNN